MRFTNAAAAAVLVSSAAFLGNVKADELEEVLGGDAPDASAAPAASKPEVPKPNFTPLTSIEAPLFEQFTDSWKTRWTPSHAKKENDKTGDEEWTYVGEWAVEEPKVLPGIKGDKGLVVKNKAAHHAISSKFAKPVDNTGKTLVVQYEVKLQDGLNCGGAYIKLLKENKELHADEFSNASPYVIMFGPDKCGSTNKVHFIFKHKNPKTGEYEEKHLTNPPAARISKKTVLYTLIVTPENTYDIRMDGVSVKSGSLFEDFSPSINPEKEIDDKDDSKPDTWVDEAMIADPEATKPEDWDEDAPYQVVDEDATKPEDWYEDEPEMVADPEAEKPEGWVDEEDGDWVPPQVPNPKCEEAAGCGPWEKPMKDNAAYKGKWTAPMISNPDYKGVWAPRKIANPDFYNDTTPSNLEPIGGVGFELWTMDADILFDNIYVGHSVADAEKIQKDTWDVKTDIEQKEDDLTVPEKPKAQPPKGGPRDLVFKEDPIHYVMENAYLFTTLLQRDPREAIRFMPEFAAALGATILASLGLLVGLLSFLIGGSSKPTPKPVKKPVVVTTDVTVDQDEAVTTGAEKPKAVKRGTSSKKE